MISVTFLNHGKICKAIYTDWKAKKIIKELQKMGFTPTIKKIVPDR